MKNHILQPLRWSTLISLLFSISLFAQTKQTSTSKGNRIKPNQEDIYIAGDYPVQGQFYGPAYTKNGERIALTQGDYGHAYSIQVVGQDVYVTGDIKDKPVYWKNGQVVYLSSTALPPASGLAIAVSGKDVYVAGNGEKPGPGVRNHLQPRYWKNGQEILLPQPAGPNGYEGEASVTSMSVIDNDVYIIGRDMYTPVYWKNGHLVEAISNDLQRVVSICQLNGDAYIVGAKDNRAAYWKNGQTTVLTSEESLATAIAIDGKDVYVTGVIGGYERKNLYPGYGNGGVGVYWKNGEVYPLEGSSPYPQYIAVSGSDVYIVGFEQDKASGNRFWKNGKITESAVDPEFLFAAQKGNGGGELKKNISETKEPKVVNESVVKEKVILTPQQEANLFFEENKSKPGVLSTASGLQYEILKRGTGPNATSSDKVKCLTEKTIMVGKKIENVSKGTSPSIIDINGLIPGMVEGFRLMNVGSKYKIYIPAKLGYGEQKTPGYTFIFDIELLEIVR